MGRVNLGRVNVFQIFYIFFMISKSEGSDTLLVTTVTPSRSERMKSTRTLDLAFLRFLLRLAT